MTTAFDILGNLIVALFMLACGIYLLWLLPNQIRGKPKFGTWTAAEWKAMFPWMRGAGVVMIICSIIKAIATFR